MDDKPIPSQEGHVIEVEKRTAAPAAEGIDRRRQSGLRAALGVIRRKVPRPPIPEESWSESPQLCSERETIASMSETLKRMVQILTKIANQLTSTSEGGNTDDGPTSKG